MLSACLRFSRPAMLRRSLILLAFSLVFCIAVATNVPSDVIELNERFLQVKDDGYWFVEFYAPWCAHCKRLMPIWEHVGHALADRKSPVRVGKLDCTRFTSVASALDIQGYPTVLFFRNGEKMVYEGERKKELMVDFAVKSAGPVVGLIESPQQLSELRKSSNDPFFVYVLGEDSLTELYNEYSWMASKLFSSRSFYRTDNKVFPPTMKFTSLPAVVVFKDNIHFVYYPKKDANLTEWISKERWSLMPLVTPSVLRHIGSNRLLVLSIVNQFDRKNDSTEVGRFHSIMMRVANAVRTNKDLALHYQFGWLDGNELANNIVLDVMNVPDILVFNASSYEYYLSGDAPSAVTMNSIISFLERVAAGEIAPLGGSSVVQRIKRFFFEVTSTFGEMFKAQPLLTICIFGLPLAFFSLITYCLCSSDFSVDRDEVYPEDDEDSDVSDTDEHEKAE